MREAVELAWAGGEHPFLLRLGEMLALEKSTAAPIGLVFSRLASSHLVGDLRWSALDVSETLRLGLIGAGMEREAARQLVAATADRAGLLALAPVALSVLHKSLAGEPVEDEAEDDPDPKPPRRAGSTKPPSTAPAR